MEVGQWVMQNRQIRMSHNYDVAEPKERII
jgi:hypothetical protein